MVNNPNSNLLIWRMRATRPRLVIPDLHMRALGCLVCVLSTAPAAGADSVRLEEIIVTAARRPEPALRNAASIARLTSEAITTVGSTHHAEILNRAPGTMIQRGSGEESLTAIRSPVLTGPGSCGAFLMLENGVPIRPVGFCNVNDMFEVNTEQAQAIEVLRGPSNSLYGSNAMHGTINVLQGAPDELPALRNRHRRGPDDYRRPEALARALGAARRPAWRRSTRTTAGGAPAQASMRAN
jgi:outer membrane cobalamin receptor